MYSQRQSEPSMSVYQSVGENITFDLLPPKAVSSQRWVLAKYLQTQKIVCDPHLSYTETSLFILNSGVLDHGFHTSPRELQGDGRNLLPSPLISHRLHVEIL